MRMIWRIIWFDIKDNNFSFIEYFTLHNLLEAQRISPNVSPGSWFLPGNGFLRDPQNNCLQPLYCLFIWSKLFDSFFSTREILSFENKWKSEEAKSDKYGGYGRNFNSANFYWSSALEYADVYHDETISFSWSFWDIFFAIVAFNFSKNAP